LRSDAGASNNRLGNYANDAFYVFGDGWKKSAAAFFRTMFAEPDPTPCLRTKPTLATDCQHDNFVKSRIAENKSVMQSQHGRYVWHAAHFHFALPLV
jgi:hypothetical protein